VQSTGAVPPRFAQPIALGGLLFFLDALLYFAYRYVVVFARELTGPVAAPAVIADITLFTVFALHHSVFARDAFRKRITRLVGALERSTYVWIASALFIAVCAWWQPVAGMVWRIHEPAVVWLLRAAQWLGVWLTLRSAWMIDFFALAGARQVWRDEGPGRSEPAGPVFTTAGPYGWVRHPIYAGWFLLVFAVPLMTMTRFVFAATSCVYLLLAIPFEERSLRSSSGGSYEAYMRKVHWKLLPGVF
jgi:methanethiol S-methyltransferase